MKDHAVSVLPTEEQGLEATRRRIQKGGKILAVICRIVRSMLSISAVIHLIALVALFVDQRVMEYVQDLYDNNAIYQLLRSSAALDAIEPLFRAAIGCFLAFLSQLAMLLFVNMIGRMMQHLAEGGRPFDVGTARKVRRYSFGLLLLTFYNVPLGLAVFGIALLFTYVMEYGGYLQQRADATNRVQEEMIVSFAEITENKSGQTGQHIKRVSEYTKILAEQLGLPEERSEALRIASTMHDIGKLLIPAEILEKPGRLTDEEYAVVKLHTTYGGQLLENVEGEEMVLSRTIALQHHERYDGRGYPASLAGEQISLEGRIVAVADVYDALTSRRSYKDAWTEDRAAQEILNGRGTQFDPQVVDAFQAAHQRIAAVQRQFAD